MNTKNDLIARMMDDMQEDLIVFIKDNVDSFVKWDLIRFFYENPHTIDSVENIARYTGRSPGAVQGELAELATHGLLEENKVGRMAVYALSSDPKVRQQIADFIQASNDPKFRPKIIFHLLKGMKA
ncbi:MAG: winged helix-turn-helix transcriptional regulator [Anaerolineae bacterium]|nr:winged helix-turn-helix transcriptional regulator [Anaerolineae bacterium]